MANHEIEFKPKVSMRTILILAFILFSVVPLGVVTIYSVFQYKKAIDQENFQKLKSKFSEFERLIKQKEQVLESSVRLKVNDKKLIYFLFNNLVDRTIEVATENLIPGEDHEVNIYARNGDLFARIKKNRSNVIEISPQSETIGFQAPKNFLVGFFKDVKRKRYLYYDFKQDILILNIFQKILTDKGRLVGYLQESISLSTDELETFKKDSGLSVVLADGEWSRILSNKYGVIPILSNEPILLKRTPKVYGDLLSKNKGYSQFQVKEEPYGLYLQTYWWGGEKLVVGVGSSIASTLAIIENINKAFLFVVVTFTGFLFVLWWLLSKKILSPIDELVYKIRKMQTDQEFSPIEKHSITELGLVTQNFNNMSLDVLDVQKELRKKLNEIEVANKTIKSAQSQLIHSAKMASLGQLVAGVAHELNNPISFISSNMLPLREYFQSLLLIIKNGEKSPKDLIRTKEDMDFDFIKKDLPKVIESCEEGAKRTKNIVLGLRSFSRLGEAELKPVNICENIENTLSILSAQLKNRITVNKEYNDIPDVVCFPSQLNQVFMNIISNAAQAIVESGDIDIIVRMFGEDMVEIQIADSGHGMDDDVLQRIFEPFFTTKDQGEGTGLGLSISFGIIEKHEGQLIVESKIGAGSKFIIRLPVEGPKEQPLSENTDRL